MKLAGIRWRLWSAVAVVVVLAGPLRLDAQLVVENASQKWIPGAVVELSVAGPETRPGARIEEVEFDGRPIAFELVDPGSEDQSIRFRIRIPVATRPGSHQVAVRFFEEASGATVPEVTGLTLTEARRLLGSRGLLADTGSAPAAPAGAFLVVTAQEPRPGMRVSSGTRVAVAVASRSEVPEIVGRSVADARLELEKRSLELATTVVPAAGSQSITSQSPIAGAIVAAGSRVTVESLVIVPDLVGREVDEMKSILASAGLRSRLVFVEPSRGQHGTVAGQDPAAGLGVPPGSVIAVVFERLADPPPHQWPWGWMALTVVLAASLLQEARKRRSLRRSFRTRASNDLAGLRQSATAPAWEGPELKLDIRLLGIPDRGRQTLEIEGPLIADAPQP